MAADPFDILRRHTRARVGLGRAGDGIPTAEVLAFQLAHARARDAVHGAVDFEALAAALQPRAAIVVDSAAGDRAVYLRRPDLGRILGEGHAERLERGAYDIVFVIADGLSSIAAESYAVETLEAAARLLPELAVAPVVLARQARVAIGDDIAVRLGAEIAVVLIGERPGLSSADSLGAYLTYRPVRGTPDSARNCISNIHTHGLSPDFAAAKIAWLVRQARKRGLSGVALKEDAETDLLPPAHAEARQIR